MFPCWGSNSRYPGGSVSIGELHKFVYVYLLQVVRQSFRLKVESKEPIDFYRQISLSGKQTAAEVPKLVLP
jgi:hypothetical protein